jgi:hypothetical protein
VSSTAMAPIRDMTSDEYPYLAQLSLPDRLRIAAYEASDHGAPAIHLRDILDAAEEIDRLIDWFEPSTRQPTIATSRCPRRTLLDAHLTALSHLLRHKGR